MHSSTYSICRNNMTTMIARRRPRPHSGVTAMTRALAVFLIIASTLAPTNAFQAGKVFGMFRRNNNDVSTVKDMTPIAKTKEELLTVISNTGNGKDASPETQKAALQLVRYLETKAPVPPNLLEDPEAAKELDGVWYLQYTAPSDIDIEDMVRIWHACSGH